MDTKNDGEYDVEALKWAFEKGYRQGKNDENEGIFIHRNSILEHFLVLLKNNRLQSADKESSTVK